MIPKKYYIKIEYLNYMPEMVGERKSSFFEDSFVININFLLEDVNHIYDLIILWRTMFLINSCSGRIEIKDLDE